VFNVSLDLAPVAQRFAPGHRIRFQVSGGAHPTYARNTCGGAPLADAVDIVVARNRLYHDASYPSHIVARCPLDAQRNERPSRNLPNAVLAKDATRRTSRSAGAPTSRPRLDSTRLNHSGLMPLLTAGRFTSGLCTNRRSQGHRVLGGPVSTPAHCRRKIGAARTKFSTRATNGRGRLSSSPRPAGGPRNPSWYHDVRVNPFVAPGRYQTCARDRMRRAARRRPLPVALGPCESEHTQWYTADQRLTTRPLHDRRPQTLPERPHSCTARAGPPCGA
jgi:hypothetical protein